MPRSSSDSTIRSGASRSSNAASRRRTGAQSPLSPHHHRPRLRPHRLRFPPRLHANGLPRPRYQHSRAPHRACPSSALPGRRATRCRPPMAQARSAFTPISPSTAATTQAVHRAPPTLGSCVRCVLISMARSTRSSTIGSSRISQTARPSFSTPMSMDDSSLGLSCRPASSRARLALSGCSSRR